MTDDLTEHDKNGVQRLLLAVENQLERADDVILAFEAIVARAATLVGVKDREEFERHFRTLVQPLVVLELKRREKETNDRRSRSRRGD